MKKTLLLILASCALATAPAKADDAVGGVFTADKTWRWQPSNVNGGAVWGNAGYQAGPMYDADAISGAWWGCGVQDGPCGDTFYGQLQHSSVGYLTGEEYLDAYMVFKADGTIEKYDKDGNLLRKGEYSIDGYNGELVDYDTYGKLNTSAGSILWPYAINTGGYQPTEFDIAYMSADRLVLKYAMPGTGGWGECTWWSFGSDDGVPVDVNYDWDCAVVDGIAYFYQGNYGPVYVGPLPDGKYEGEIVIPNQVEIPGELTTVVREVRGIKTGAFADCPNLTKVTININLRQIEDNAFSDCPALSEIELITFRPENIQVDENAFSNVSKGSVKLTVFDGMESAFRSMPAWRFFDIQPKPFELSLDLLGIEKIVEGYYVYYVVRVKDYPWLNTDNRNLSGLYFSCSDHDILEMGQDLGFICKKPGKVQIILRKLNTVLVEDIEVLEAFKLPQPDDPAYSVELLAEGKDLCFVNATEPETVYYPDADGNFEINGALYAYTLLPDMDDADCVYYMSFDLSEFSFSAISAHFQNFMDGSIWGGPSFGSASFFYDYNLPVNSYSLSIDTNDYVNFSPKDLSVVMYTGNHASVSNLKVYRVKKTDALSDISLDSDLTTRYYNLQGVRVSNPLPGNVYVKVQGGKASKVVVR